MSKILIGNLRPPIATTTNLGISKPDGTTIGVNNEGTLSSLVKASGLNVTDTQGIVVPKVEEVAQETTMQALIDAVANKVMNQLVSNSTLATTLADYVTKAMIKTEFEDSDETVPASSLVNQLNSDIETIGDWKVIKQGNGLCIALARTRRSFSFLTHVGGAYYANSSFIKYLPEGLFQTVDNLFCTVTASSSGIFVASYGNNWEYSTSETPNIILASLANLEGVSCDVSLMVVGTWQ